MTYVQNGGGPISSEFSFVSSPVTSPETTVNVSPSQTP